MTFLTWEGFNDVVIIVHKPYIDITRSKSKDYFAYNKFQSKEFKGRVELLTGFKFTGVW